MTPKLSIAVPYHDTPYTDIFLARLLHSLAKQTFRDFELVFSHNGKGMAANTNNAIKQAKGEIIKIMYMDDFFNLPSALEIIVEQFNNPKTYWCMAGATNNELPKWTDDLEKGNNKLGSPSALAFRNKSPLLFDETMTWLLDCDLYKRIEKKHGLPVIIGGPHIGIGIHPGQMTNILTDEEKLKEHEYLIKKYAKIDKE